MRKTLLIASSALLLGACSFMSPQGPKTHHAAYGYGPQGNPCVPSVRPCVVAPPKAKPCVPAAKPCFTPPPPPKAQPCVPAVQPCLSNYPVSPSHNMGYGHKTTQLGAHAPYGQAVHHKKPGYGHHGLRGPHQTMPYKYGTLGLIGYESDTDLLGVQGRLGYQSAQYVGAEVEGSFGISGEDVAGVEQEVDYTVGAFALGRLPLGERFSAHARGGYNFTRTSAEALGVSASRTEDGFAYGVGGEFAVTPRDAIRLDYTIYEVDNGQLDSLALAYSRKF